MHLFLISVPYYEAFYTYPETPCIAVSKNDGLHNFLSLDLGLRAI